MHPVLKRCYELLQARSQKVESERGRVLVGDTQYEQAPEESAEFLGDEDALEVTDDEIPSTQNSLDEAPTSVQVRA
jgi:hypothetical protein